MNTTQAGIEKLNMLAAALLTALTIHTLMCGAALFGMGFAGLASILGVIRAVWLLAGVAAGCFLAYKAASLINGRSYQDSRMAVLGSFALPLLGSAGAVSAFALIPLGAIALYLLKQPEIQALFTDAVPEVPVTEFAAPDYAASEEVEVAEAA